MKKISYSFPILNRIWGKVFKSKYFISLTSTFFVVFLIFNIVVGANANKGNYLDNWIITSYILNFAALGIYFCLLQMWYIAKFNIEDRKSGIFSLELRNGFSSKSIFWQRITPIFTISTLAFVVVNLIYLINLVSWGSPILTSSAGNLFLGMFIILFINYLVGSILVLISNFSSILFLGTVGAIMMILFAFNFLWTMLTTMGSNLYDNTIAERMAQYQIIYKTKEFEEKYSGQEQNFEQLVEGFSDLQNYHITSKDNSTYYRLCRTVEESWYAGLNYCVKNGVSIFALEQADVEENYYLSFLNDLNNDFLADKPIQKSQLDEIWSETYFDKTNQTTFNFEGTYNFDSLIEFINLSNNQFLIDLSEIVEAVVHDIFTWYEYIDEYSSQGSLNIAISYLPGSINEWIESDWNTINPAIRLYEMGLEFIISNRLNAEKLYIDDFKEEESNLSASQYYRNQAALSLYLNPFLLAQSTYLYNTFRIDEFMDMKLSYKSKMWLTPVFSIYDIKIDPYKDDDVYFKTLDQSNLKSITKMKHYFNPIYTYLIITAIISSLMSIAYVIFNKKIYSV